jgi:hypothetical protein
MKRFISVLTGLFALGWSGIALAQATSCPGPPSGFICAFSAAETMSLVTSKQAGTPGQPDVFVGYMSFDTSSNVTLTGLQNINGVVGQIGGSGGLTSTAPCSAGTAGQPATVTFNDNSEIAFVTDNSGNELQFILSKDKNSKSSTANNSVRVGVCRKQ